MKKILNSVILGMMLMACMLSTSCVSTKKIVYFQGSDTVFAQPQQIMQQYEMRLKPADQVMIKITCAEPELLEIFAQDVTMGTRNMYSSAYTSGSINNTYGYTVTNGGDLILPAIGKIHVEHMTTEEAARLIENRVKEMDLIKEPEVTVLLLNARVTVIGAVGAPRVVSLTSERNTVIDVLAQCGDLEDLSLRRKVRLYREEDGKRTMYNLDMTTADIFSSPAFYVQQNDMIYVEPNKSKSIKSSSAYTFLGAGSSILGLVSSIVALVFAIKK